MDSKRELSAILAIDPGPVKSGFIVWDGRVIDCGELSNTEMLAQIDIGRFAVLTCAIEMVASYGMAVGADVFETVFWIGRFYERVPFDIRRMRVFRRDVKMHLCHSMKAKDGNIRQALIDKHGPPGTKKNPGKLYGVSGHIWAALAIADYVADTSLPHDLR